MHSRPRGSYSGRDMRKEWLDEKRYEEFDQLVIAFGVLVVILLILFTALSFVVIFSSLVFDVFGGMSNPPGMGGD
jgi:hypothetical protein